MISKPMFMWSILPATLSSRVAPTQAVRHDLSRGLPMRKSKLSGHLWFCVFLKMNYMCLFSVYLLMLNKFCWSPSPNPFWNKGTARVHSMGHRQYPCDHVTKYHQDELCSFLNDSPDSLYAHHLNNAWFHTTVGTNQAALILSYGPSGVGRGSQPIRKWQLQIWPRTFLLHTGGYRLLGLSTSRINQYYEVIFVEVEERRLVYSFYLRPVLEFGYYRCPCLSMRPSVCLSVCLYVSSTSLSTRYRPPGETF